MEILPIFKLKLILLRDIKKGKIALISFIKSINLLS